jgi:hypothetical protein
MAMPGLAVAILGKKKRSKGDVSAMDDERRQLRKDVVMDLMKSLKSGDADAFLEAFEAVNELRESDEIDDDDDGSMRPEF